MFKSRLQLWSVLGAVLECGVGLLSFRGTVRIGAWSWTAELLRGCEYWSVEVDC